MIRLLRLAAVAGLLLGAGLFVVHAADLVRRDLPGDYVEGVVLSAQLDAAAGHSPFDPRGWAEPPYRIHLYGPVFYQLGGALLHLAGGVASLVPGRLLSLAGLGLALASSWVLSRRAGAGQMAATVGLLAPLSFLPVLIFAPQNRVDTLAAGLALAGLAVGTFERPRSPLYAGGLFSLALFTKPTALAAPVALWLDLVRRREIRAAAKLLAAAVATGLFGLWLVQWTSNGGFTAAVFGFNGANPFSVGGWVKAIASILAQPLIAIAAGLAIGGLSAGENRERAVSLYFLVALGLALATVGKVGANVNYFVEPGLAAGPVIALGWERGARGIRELSLALALIAATLAVAAPRVALEWRGRAERGAAEAELLPTLAGRTVLTMEVTTALRAGATVYLNDPSIFACLTAAGRFDERRLLDDLERGAITAVLADADLSEANPTYSNWSPRVRTAVVQSFEMRRIFGRNLYLYLRPESPR